MKNCCSPADRFGRVCECSRNLGTLHFLRAAHPNSRCRSPIVILMTKMAAPVRPPPPFQVHLRPTTTTTATTHAAAASERWAPTLGIGANGTAALAFHRGPPQQQQKQQQDDANQMVLAAARDDTLGANCPSGAQFRFLDRLHDKRQLVALILFVEYQAELKYALAVVGLGTHSHLSVENCGGRIGLSSRPSRINNVGWGSVRGGREGRREREGGKFKPIRRRRRQ